MQRRNFLARSAAMAPAIAAAALSGTTASAQATGTKRSFVLVHGAWHGGWCWVRVAERLRAAGHVVYTPTLSGLGERRHLLSPLITIETHILDLLNVIEFEELKDVILVGHSYAGSIISGVADRVPGRLRQLVYLDAQMLQNGETLFSSLPKDLVDARLKAFRETGAGVGAAATLSPTAFGVKDPADIEWVARRLTPHPVGVYNHPLILNFPMGNGVPKTYIECMDNPPGNLEPGKARVRADPGWKVLKLNTGHDAMITAPGPLTDMLLQFV